MPKVFSKDVTKLLGKNYQSKVRQTTRGGCMRAVYIGLGSLYGKEFGFRGAFHKAFFRKVRKLEIRRGVPEGRLNTIDRVFRGLEDEGIAMEEQVFKPKGSEWERKDGSIIPSLEDELVDQIIELPKGSHFFGAAINGAIHSILIRIERTTSETTVFWMDQFSNGYDAVRPNGFVNSPNVTFSLDETILRFGKKKTMVWRLDPEGSDTPIDM